MPAAFIYHYCQAVLLRVMHRTVTAGFNSIYIFAKAALRAKLACS